MAKEIVPTHLRLLNGQVFYDEPVSETVRLLHQDSDDHGAHGISPGQAELRSIT